MGADCRPEAVGEEGAMVLMAHGECEGGHHRLPCKQTTASRLPKRPLALAVTEK